MFSFFVGAIFCRTRLLWLVKNRPFTTIRGVLCWFGFWVRLLFRLRAFAFSSPLIVPPLLKMSQSRSVPASKRSTPNTPRLNALIPSHNLRSIPHRDPVTRKKPTGENVRSSVGHHPEEILHGYRVTFVMLSDGSSDSRYGGRHLCGYC